MKPLGAVIRTASAITPPASPAQAVLTTKARTRARARLIPAISAATSSSRTARQVRPTRLRDRFASSTKVRTSAIQPM